MQCDMPCKATKDTAKKIVRPCADCPRQIRDPEGNIPPASPHGQLPARPPATCPCRAHPAGEPVPMPQAPLWPRPPAHGEHGPSLMGAWCNSAEWVWDSSTKLCFIASGSEMSIEFHYRDLILYMLWTYLSKGILLDKWLSNQDSVSAVGIVSRGEAECVGCCGFNRSRDIWD